MNGKEARGQAGDLLELFPREFQDKEVHRRLRKLMRELDDLVFEEKGELFVDAEVAARLLRDPEVFPDPVRGAAQKGVEKHLRQRTRGTGRRLTWRELATRSEVPIAPMSVEELRGLGLSRATSGKDARRIIAGHVPDFPSKLLDADAAAIQEIAVQGIGHNRTVWDCVVSKIGYWAALAVFAAFGALLIIGTATGPWGVPLAIFLAATLGGGTAVIVANCVLNPNR